MASVEDQGALLMTAAEMNEELKRNFWAGFRGDEPLPLELDHFQGVGVVGVPREDNPQGEEEGANTPVVETAHVQIQTETVSLGFVS